MTVPRSRPPEAASAGGSRDPAVIGPVSDPSGITVVDMITILLRYRVMIVVIGLSLALVKGIQVISLPRYYSTDAEFMPEGSHGQSQISGLAQQFGINISSDGGDAPQFYVDLIDSRSILGEVARKDYVMKTDTGVFHGSLVQLFGASKLPQRYQVPVVIGQLKHLIDVDVSPKTGVMTLTVRALTADLAVQIANSVLVEVNTFNLTRRQRQAGAERVFVEKRQAEAQIELRDAESNLESFLIQNHDFNRSPTLQMDYTRLNSAVAMRQTLYTSLTSAYEQAKIEEVRDLPVITILAPPELPLVPESKRGTRKVMLALILGLGLGAIIAFIRAGLAASTRGHPNDAAEFEMLKRESLTDLTHPWRPLGRVFASRRRRETAT